MFLNHNVNFLFQNPAKDVLFHSMTTTMN